MGQAMVIASLFGVLVVFFIVDKGVRKWLNIHKTEQASRYVNRFHLLGSIALLAVFILILTQDSGDANLFTSDQLYPIAGLLLASQLFDVFMHWKYHDNPREYIITLIFSGITLVIVSGVLLIRGINT